MRYGQNRQIAASLNRAMMYSKKAAIILKVLLCIYLLIAIPVFGVSVVTGLTANRDFPDMLSFGLRLLPALLSIIVSTCVFLLLAKIFNEISAGCSPFTTQHSNAFKIIGWLLIANVAFGAIASLAPLPPTITGELTAGLFVSSTDPSGISVDYSSFLWAIVCFCLSNAFLYGASLQRFNDETI